MFASRLVLHRALGLTAGVLIGTKLVGKQAQRGLETRPLGSLLISCYPAVYLRGTQHPLYAHQKETRNAFACQALQRDVWRATKNKIDRGFLNCWSNHCGNLNVLVGMGAFSLGDLLGPFEGHDVGGLVHVTINARAKGDVGVGAAPITG